MAYQVTATEGANSVNGVLLRVKVLTGAAPASAQTGATKIADTSVSPFYDQSITTTVTGSVVYGAMSDGNTAFSMTADARTTLIDNFADNTQGCQYVSFKATSATGTPGATTLGATSPGGGEHGNYAAAEILAAGTITEDASGPAVATTTSAKNVQTAAFTPPPGSLLVAMVAHCSSGVSSITITNNGGTLTWVQLAYESTSGGAGAGIWVASVPAAQQPSAPRIYAPGWHPGRGLPGLPGGTPFAIARPAAQPGPVVIAGTAEADAAGSATGLVTQVTTGAAAAAGTAAGSASRYITGVGGTGASYFADNTGSPRLVWGDAAWALPGNAGRWNSGNWQADYDTYFATRAAQGFTIIYLKPIGTTQSGNLDDFGKTFDSLYPFQGGTPSTGVSGANPSTGLTSAFWARIDYMLNSALAQGITIFFNAIGYSSDFDSGPGPLAGKSGTEFTAYGTALGTRYKNQPNLVWHLADDYFSDDDSVITAFMSGVTGAGDTHAVSIENLPESTSRFTLDASPTTLPWGDANADYNFVYSYNQEYYGIERAYAEASPITVIQGDGYFYQGGSGYSSTFDRAFRQAAWWSLASGARGKVHGSESIWQWASTALAASSSDWWYVNNSLAIVTAFTSLNGWHQLVPDTGSALVTGGRGTRASAFTSGGSGGQYEPAFTSAYVAASRTPDSGSGSSLAVLYLPNHTTITIDQTKMASGYTATWVDPVTGATSPATAGSTYSSTAKGNNSQGDPDWVLVLQGPASTPGTATAAAASQVTALVTQVTIGEGDGAASAAGRVTIIATATAAGASTATGLATLGASGTAGAASTAAGSVSEVITGASAGAGTATGLVTQAVTATAAAAGTAAGTGSVIAPGTATAAAAGTAAGLVSQRCTGEGDAAAAAIGLVAEQVTGTAPGQGSVTAAGSVAGSATAASSSTATGLARQGVTVTAAAAGAATGAASVAGSATAAAACTVAGLVTEIVTATGPGATTATGLVVQRVTASAAAAATATGNATSTSGQSGEADGHGSVTAVVVQRVTGEADSSGTAAGAVVQKATASAAGAGSAAGLVTQQVTASAAGASTATGTSSSATGSTAEADAASSATGLVTQRAVAQAAASGTATGTPSQATAGTAAAAATGSVAEIFTLTASALAAASSSATGTSRTAAPAAVLSGTATAASLSGSAAVVPGPGGTAATQALEGSASLG